MVNVPLLIFCVVAVVAVVVMEEEDHGVVAVCRVGDSPKKPFVSRVMSFSEYVLHQLDLAPDSSAAHAVNLAVGDYLFRRTSESALLRMIQEHIKPLGTETATLLLRELRQRRSEYFSRRWDLYEEMIEVNREEHNRWAAQVHASLRDANQEDQLVELARPEHLANVSLGVLLVSAPFCSWCRMVEPAALQQLKQLGVTVFRVDARSTALVDHLGTASFPEVLLWRSSAVAGRLVLKTMESVKKTMEEWLRGLGFDVSPNRLRQPMDPKELLQLRQELATQRRDVSAKMALRALGNCSRKSLSSRAPPIAVLLGGGIAAGKTSLVTVLNEIPEWSGREAVVIEADQFKLVDPLFGVVMRKSGLAEAIRAVHRDSTDASESLLIEAVERGNDIVLDGTSKWAPFVIQTIAMLRKAHTHKTRRGPGYQGPNKEEVYWIQDELRDVPLEQPYQIWLLGTSCAVNVAVGRSIRRGILDGRWTGLEDLLRSHKLFAAHFEEYALLVDKALLFDNTKSREAETPPPLLAELRGQERRVLGEESFDRFTKQQFLRIQAKSVHSLYRADDDGEEEMLSSAAPSVPGLREMLERLNFIIN